jgi:hypothetical protein
MADPTVAARGGLLDWWFRKSNTGSSRICVCIRGTRADGVVKVAAAFRTPHAGSRARQSHQSRCRPPAVWDHLLQWDGTT